MKRALLMLLALVLATACGDETPRTQVMAIVMAETGVAAATSEVQIRVRSTSDGDEIVRVDETTSIDERPFPINVAIVPLDGDASRTFRISAAALDGDGEIITIARAESGFISERTLGLVVWLRDRCVGVTCPDTDTCNSEGGCEPAFVPPESLPNLEDLDAAVPPDAGMDADTSVDADAGDSAVDAPVDTRVCEATETACVDGLDEDCDGMTDCEDPDCVDAVCDDGLYCNGVDTCEAGGCNGHPGDPCLAPSTCNEDMDRCEGCSATPCPADEPGSWGACGGFADTCAAMGERSRPVTQYMCVSDACEASTITRTEACMRASRDGVTCGSSTISDGPCVRTGCGTAGTLVRTTTPMVCMGGGCRAGTPGTTSVSCMLSGNASDGTDCATGYCCSGACVAKNSTAHCGACGVRCAGALACEPAISNNGGRHNLPDAFVCRCTGFADCRPSYGSGATCFDGHCQCLCPASAPTSCTGSCVSGLCDKDTIEPMSDNFCRY